MSFGEVNDFETVREVLPPVAFAIGLVAVQVDITKQENREGLTFWANKLVYVGVSNSVSPTDAYMFKVFPNQLISFRSTSNVDIWVVSDTASIGSDDILVGQYK